MSLACLRLKRGCATCQRLQGACRETVLSNFGSLQYAAQALLGAACAAIALGGDAQSLPEVAHAAGALIYGMLDMTFGDGIADADVHGDRPIS